MIKIAIIDYGSGNLHSISKAVLKAAKEVDELAIIELVTAPEQLDDATHIILPGVGAFGDCKRGLVALPGMIERLERSVLKNKKPFLGICVGMQLLAKKGLEHGEHDGLGWIDGVVRPIQAADANLKIPHMGWNDLVITHDHPLLKGINNGEHTYFVHSFHMECVDPEVIIAQVNYGGAITAAVAKGHIMGVQFHPEKSQNVGLQVIKNFIKETK